MFAALPGWHVLLPDANGGKRVAQDHAVRIGSGELVVTIDSDTRIAPDGIRQLVGVFADPRVGAATGDVRVGNAGVNLLTRLIDLRYWVAFNQERAAQGLFGSVLCCSGPFAVYRRDVLSRVWRRYVTQTFRGTDCTYGDDRHLTNLVLAEGFRTVFTPQARAITSAPTTLRTYLRQQLRWNKSYYRELLWTLSFLPRLAVYMSFEVLAQTVLPVLLVLALATTVVRTAQHPTHVLTYVGFVAVMAVAHCGYGIYRTRDWRFLCFVAYGFIHAALLVPVRIRAVTTLTDNRWGTRTVAPPPGIAAGASLAAA
jgi:hyaluronan synthase/N-acetylglucosaminyltransferase